MRIFVTGATGLVGSAVCREAIKNGHQIIALRRPSSVSSFSEEEEKHISWVLDDDNLQVNVNNYKPDVLAHFAWGRLSENLIRMQTTKLSIFLLLFIVN